MKILLIFSDVYGYIEKTLNDMLPDYYSKNLDNPNISKIFHDFDELRNEVEDPFEIMAHESTLIMSYKNAHNIYVNCLYDMDFPYAKIIPTSGSWSHAGWITIEKDDPIWYEAI